MRRIVFAAIAIAVVLDAGAEAWPRGDGKSYVYLGAATMLSTDFRMPDGSIVPFPGRDNRERRLTLYAEYGLTDELTLVVNAPYKDVRTRGNVSTFETSGLADLDVRLRWSAGIRGTWMAVEGGATVPLGYDADAFPPLGTGKTDAIVNLAFGTSLGWLPEGFLSVDVGYRFRGGEIKDEVPFAVKIGAFPFSRVGIFAVTRGWKSRADFSRVDPNLGLFIADSEKTAAGIELYFRLTDRFDANVTWMTTVSGRNIGNGDEYGAGVALHLD